MPERPDSYERMPFLKLYSREWLQGSLRIENDAAERGVWTDFLALANESRNRGVIQANDETPYPHPYLAALLNIPLELLEHCIQKFTLQNRIIENEHGILVVNFTYWQGLDTRRRGRPSKQDRGDSSKYDTADNRYHTLLGLEYKKLKKKLGRDPHAGEFEELKVRISKEVYGDHGTGEG